MDWSVLIKALIPLPQPSSLFLPVKQYWLHFGMILIWLDQESYVIKSFLGLFLWLLKSTTSYLFILAFPLMLIGFYGLIGMMFVLSMIENASHIRYKTNLCCQFMLLFFLVKLLPACCGSARNHNIFYFYIPVWFHQMDTSYCSYWL